MDMAKEGFETLKDYIDKTTLPNILTHYGVGGKSLNEIEEMINWRFFDQIPRTSLHLLNAMQRLISETKFEAPLLQTIEALSRYPTNVTSQTSLNDTQDSSSVDNPIRRPSSPLYVYTFHMSNTLDLRGTINYFGGASHSSDLLFLMGPSLFQQISRRKFSSAELKQCKKLRQLFSNFVKKGNPTPDRLYDAWRPYTTRQKFIQILGDPVAEAGSLGGVGSASYSNSFEQNRVELEAMLQSPPGNTETRIVSNAANPYRIGPEAADGTKSNERSRMSKSYLGGYETTEYYNSLMKVYTFWNELLPKIYRHQRGDSQDEVLEMEAGDANGRRPLSAGVVTGSKYKHAFFSMLILVCLLLAVLCVCVYILKKNHRNIDTTFL